MKNILYVLLGLMAGFALAGLVFMVSRAPDGEPIQLLPAPTKSPLAVHVVGAVPRPGLYEFAEGARMQDAINAAGGLLASANVDVINLALLLEDGQQLSIPYKDGAGPVVAQNSGTVELPYTESDIPPEFVEPAPDETFAGDLININLASQEELESLTGIGSTLAQRIIDYRENVSQFYSIEDITYVEGIGDIGSATYENIKDFIMTGYE
jgi:competence protein ComEA